VNTDGAVEYFAAVFIFKKIYQGREEIGRADNTSKATGKNLLI